MAWARVASHCKSSSKTFLASSSRPCRASHLGDSGMTKITAYARHAGGTTPSPSINLQAHAQLPSDALMIKAMI